MKQSLLFILLVSGLFPVLFAQNVAVKTNGLYWLTMTPNAGIEFALNKKVTLDLSAAYNPWTFKADKKMRFWFVQPEAKYWFCEKFEGHFVGLHLHGAQYFGGFKEKRYDGYLLGGDLRMATTGFCLLIGILKQLSVSVMPTSGIKKVIVFLVLNVTKTSIKITLVLPKQPFL